MSWITTSAIQISLSTNATHSTFNRNQLPGWQVVHPQIVTFARSMLLHFFHHLQWCISAGSLGWCDAFALNEWGYGSSGSTGCLSTWLCPQSCGVHQPRELEQLLQSVEGWSEVGITPLLTHACSPALTARATTTSTAPQRQDPAPWSHCSWAMLIHGFCWHSNGRGLVHLMSCSRWLSQKHHRWKK